MLISAAVLSMIAGVQTSMAQKVTLYMAGNQTFECDITRLDSIVFSEGQTIPAEEIVVTVDANGNADGGHLFTKIDDNKFYIDDIKYTAESGALIVTGYDKAYFKGAANIISKLIYNGRTLDVVGIASNAFEKCGVLTSVTIPNSVTSIGNQAFVSCTSLTSVTIPNSVTSIGSSAFMGCSGLTSITIPNSVTSIGNSAFSGCTGLTAVHINDIAAWCKINFYDSSSNPLYYAKHLYLNGEELKDLTIPNSVTSIGYYAFVGCTSLTSITIPNSVTSIGYYAFYGCSGLTSVTIPNSVTSIGNSAFWNCTGLTSVTLDNNAIVSAERLDTSMKSIFGNQVRTYVLGNSVTRIGKYAFYGCSGLTSVTIPNSVTSIGDYAFDGCTSLTAVTIPNSVTSIGSVAFQSCKSLTSITIGNSVTSIGGYAFNGCTSLTSITIGSGVTSIGSSAFYDCQSLTDVYCYAENVPSTYSYAFENSSISSATLHVPARSVNSYKSQSPWSSFGSIVAIE